MSTIGLMSKTTMTYTVGTIVRLEVRCPCGTSYEDADTYLQHRRYCNLHTGQENMPVASSHSKREPSKIVASLLDSGSPLKPVGCSCGRTFKNQRALHQHTSSSAVHKKEPELRSDPVAPDQLVKSNPDTPLTTATRALAPTTASTSNNIQCACGKSFTNAKKLQNHLRHSKTHRRNNGAPAPSSKAVAPPPSAVQIGPLPGTIPTSMPPTASFFHCTYSGMFETKGVLALHKRDWCRQASKTETYSESSDAFLAACLTNLKLNSVGAQPEPLVGRDSCSCRDGFANQAALGQHRYHEARCAVREGGGIKNKKFYTPRPKYHKDEYLEDWVALQNLQYSSM
ncbi:hypothetical protein HBI88_138170 [Parastagonospora nodorum]|nr:hypothetical protein HBH71_071750 [Parastagonospora nodorum]KAH5768424.1 hypothetical protein HBI97_167260 [Parastagonospora nodorum]KAH5823141.1 hypothetical protein HBI96_032740 [Parastagonospora nodorum]KAH5835974.1 hypothetical protein HBI94_001960 [Parastagonospora nodorum]KAH5841307.1 hypothetical protein HBI93_026510 [Parastagonospora nodorum]